MNLAQLQQELKDREAELHRTLIRMEGLQAIAARIRHEINTVMQDIASAERREKQLELEERQIRVVASRVGLTVDIRRFTNGKGIECLSVLIPIPGERGETIEYIPHSGAVRPKYERSIAVEFVEQAFAYALAIANGGGVTYREVIDSMEAALLSMDCNDCGNTGGAKELRRTLERVKGDQTTEAYAAAAHRKARKVLSDGAGPE